MASLLNAPALIENAVGMALLRRYEPADRLLETFILPERLHIWRWGEGQCPDARGGAGAGDARHLLHSVWFAACILYD
jgi:hypothetical protein